MNVSWGEEAQGEGTIVLCGPFSGKGRRILKELGSFLRELGFSAHTVDELYPVPQQSKYTPEQARECSYRALDQSAAALFVFLSPLTLGLAPGERDLSGGAAFEFGLLYRAARDKVGPRLAAFLFDGQSCRTQPPLCFRGNGKGPILTT